MKWFGFFYYISCSSFAGGSRAAVLHHVVSNVSFSHRYLKFIIFFFSFLFVCCHSLVCSLCVETDWRMEKAYNYVLTFTVVDSCRFAMVFGWMMKTVDPLSHRVPRMPFCVCVHERDCANVNVLSTVEMSKRRAFKRETWKKSRTNILCIIFSVCRQWFCFCLALAAVSDKESTLKCFSLPIKVMWN